MSATSQKPLRVLFILKNMAMGGISKVACQYMAALQKESTVKLSVLIFAPVRDAWAVDFFESHHIDYRDGFMLDTGTAKKRFFLCKWFLKARAHFQKKSLSKRIRNILEQNDILLDFSSLEAYRYIRRAGKPMVGWVHCNFPNFQNKIAHKIALPEYARIVGLTDDFCRVYRQAYPELAEKVIRLYNPIDVDAAHQAAEVQGRDISSPCFVCIQRLDREKATDVVIRAFERFHRKRPEYKLYIVGDGSKRAELQSMTKNEDVVFTGMLANPFPLLQKAYGLILSSTKEYGEGFPTVLVEAQALGVLAIAADVPSGPADILVSGKAGYLFEPESVDSLYAALCHAADSPAESAEKVATATAQLGRFRVENIIADLVRELHSISQNSYE